MEMTGLRREKARGASACLFPEEQAQLFVSRPKSAFTRRALLWYTEHGPLWRPGRADSEQEG